MMLNVIVKYLAMALSKLRNDFRRAVNRTAVSLFLGASLLAPLAVAGAQQATDTVASPPAATAMVAETQADTTTLRLEKGVVSAVTLQAAGDVDALAQEYPFLAEQVKFTKEFYESSGQETTFSTARAFDAESNTTLLFVSQTGRLACGELGCSLAVYADQGEGYKEALNLLAFGEFYVGKNEDGKISTFFCANEAYSDWSRSEWQLNGDTFEHQKRVSQVPVVNNVPICSTPQR